MTPTDNPDSLPSARSLMQAIEDARHHACAADGEDCDFNHCIEFILERASELDAQQGEVRQEAQKYWFKRNDRRTVLPIGTTDGLLTGSEKDAKHWRNTEPYSVFELYDRQEAPREGVRVTDALQRAAKQFRHYEFLHQQKHTEEAVVKSQTNAAYAEMCERALESFAASLSHRPVTGVEGIAKWQPIETAPTDDTMFLAGWTDGRMCVMRGSILAAQKGRAIPSPPHLQFNCTHWMPLPPAPAIEAGKQSGSHSSNRGEEGK